MITLTEKHHEQIVCCTNIIPSAHPLPRTLPRWTWTIRNTYITFRFLVHRFTTLYLSAIARRSVRFWIVTVAANGKNLRPAISSLRRLYPYYFYVAYSFQRAFPLLLPPLGSQISWCILITSSTPPLFPGALHRRRSSDISGEARTQAESQYEHCEILYPVWIKHEL